MTLPMTLSDFWKVNSCIRNTSRTIILKYIYDTYELNYNENRVSYANFTVMFD